MSGNELSLPLQGCVNFSSTSLSSYLLSHDSRPGGWGLLSYETLTGTCGPIGYDFQGVLS